MTPIPFALPAGRILPPTTAYAAGLVCELRPDLADGVRAAVLGEDAAAELHRLTLACGAAGDGQGNAACYCLRLFVERHEPSHADRSYLHALADILNLIPRRTAAMTVITEDGSERGGDPTIGDVWAVSGQGFVVAGLGVIGLGDRRVARWGASIVVRCFHHGFDQAWQLARFQGEYEALRRLIPLYAHTISLDPDTRAAWAKAHLDALVEPVRPMSPDRLN